jgi:DNA repair exonuclease SbcCD ATPase subunit
MVVIAVMLGGFYFYYTNTQTTIATLNQNNAKLTTAVELNEQTINTLQADYAKVTVELTQVNTEFQAARDQNAELQERLSKNDIGVLANGKPKLVERVVNNASKKAARCFELLSGAILTDKERNATSARDFNSECPWLWKRQ